MFEKFYSNHKTAVLIAIFIISIIAYGLMGYAIGRNVQSGISAPGIQFIPDINPGVCAIDIDEIGNYVLRGHVGEKYVRLRYKGKILIPDKSGGFAIQY